MLKNVMAGLVATVLFVNGLALAGVADKENAAVNAAGAWLKIVDEGDYTQSWQEAAGFFKAAVPKEQWEQSMQAFREPLGKMISRNLKTKTYATSLPGAPDGEYVVIQYETRFEHKQSAVETITPMLDKDGNWRVSGYYIK